VVIEIMLCAYAGAVDRMRSLAPPLLLVAVLTALAATPGLNSGLGDIDAVARTLLHGVLYAALFVLIRRALGGRDALAAALALVVAVADEVIQSYVPGRDSTPVDVLIDAAGIAVGWLLVRRRGRERATA
jgi:VanZ family protein